MKKNKNETVKPIIFEGISFYPASVKGKTLQQFSEHEKHHNLSKEKLKEVYELLTGTTAAK